MLQNTFYLMLEYVRTSNPLFPRLSQSSSHFSIILADLGKSELLVRDLPKLCSFWELDQEVQVKSGAGDLSIDEEMVQGFVKAFREPLMMSKVTDAAYIYKVPVDLYSVLFKTPKVEEGMVKQVGNSSTSHGPRCFWCFVTAGPLGPCSCLPPLLVPCSL